MLLPALLLALAAADADIPPQPETEVLVYSVNWPSGLSLGEARFTFRLEALPNQPELRERRQEMVLEANLPGFPIVDRYTSRATPDFCALELTKEFTHGKRAGQETTTVKLDELIARRATRNGGSSEFKVAPCPKDALTYLYFLRRELRAGRLPPPQPVLFGATYETTSSFVRRQRLLLNGEAFDTDQIDISFKGPASQKKFSVFFSRDEARTPVLFQVPFELGVFSLELTR